MRLLNCHCWCGAGSLCHDGSLKSVHSRLVDPLIVRIVAIEIGIFPQSIARFSYTTSIEEPETYLLARTFDIMQLFVELVV